MDDVYQSFVETLIEGRQKITNIPSFVFLCGGPEPKVGEKPTHARPAFRDFLAETEPELHRNLIWAEDATDGYEKEGDSRTY